MSHEFNKWFFSLKTKKLTHSSCQYSTFNMEMVALSLCEIVCKFSFVEAVKTFLIVDVRRETSRDEFKQGLNFHHRVLTYGLQYTYSLLGLA